MSAPRRWKDTPNAPVGVRELLSAARPPRAIPGAAFDRGASNLAKRSAVPAVAAVAASLWTKVAAATVLAVATLGATAGVQFALRPSPPLESSSPSPSPSPAQVSAPLSIAPAPAPAPVLIASAEPEVAVTPAPVPAPVLIASAEPGIAVAPAPVRIASAEPEIAVAPAPAGIPTSTLSSELPLLESARASLARDPQSALTTLAEHRALYPGGVLSTERDLMELDALRRVGRTHEARTRAEAWLSRDPSGLHANRVRAILASLPSES